MNPIAGQDIESSGGTIDRRRGRLTLGGRTHLVRHVGRVRREAGNGVRQVVVGHELTWRPELSGTGYGWLRLEPQRDAGSFTSGRDHGTYLSNEGGSPAIGARYVYRRPEAPGWFLSDPVDVPAHGAETEVLRGRLVDEKLARMWLGSITVRETLAGAIFCRDFLHRSWCFPISDADDGSVLEAIVWRKGAPAPGWAASHDLWGPQAA